MVLAVAMAGARPKDMMELLRRLLPSLHDPNVVRSPRPATLVAFTAPNATTISLAPTASTEVSGAATTALPTYEHCPRLSGIHDPSLHGFAAAHKILSQLTASREIQRLRTQVRDLEQQLQRQDLSPNNTVTSLATPPVSCAPLPSPAFADTRLDPGKEHGRPKKYWEGIYTSTAQSLQTQYYGPASSFYFIGRMSSYLATALQQPHSHHHMQPNSASRTFATPTSPKRGPLDDVGVAVDGPTAADTLTGTQEDYFLDLFWQSYHCVLQIIDEVEFKEHYKSLWVAPGKSRKPSALVDIVLALCMQYGVAFVPRSGASPQTQVDVDGNDATIAGRWLYRRSQTLLSAELESPSIMTLQCHILAVYYLCNASFQNMAHSTLAVAVRTAQILGLHIEPPESMPRKTKELRKRLWWTLFTVESKTCMKLGRPLSAQISEATCSLPADDHELALLSGSSLASSEDNVTWHTYSLQNTKLILAARTAYLAFHDKCAEVLAAIDGTTLYSDAQALETCAHFLSTGMECLRSWRHGVPNGLKTKRKASGEPFSTDKSPLDLELYAPLWLQRQRLLLELLYHNLSMNLHRPFISFFTLPSSSSSLQLAHGHAIACVDHAIVITQIMHQILMEGDTLRGWHEAFQWQWNATLSLIGYILAYPLAPPTPSARQAIDSAIDVFETFGRNFAIAASAANVTRDLIAKADFLIYRASGNGIITPVTPSSSDFGVLQANAGADYEAQGSNAMFESDMEPSGMFQNTLSGMDLAFTVDSFNSFEPVLPGSTNLANLWNLSCD
ncbi:MAG: hypothetical protein L6R39_000037 [Caloplaca ligustica]|nr:MAG: hypothetical protein L6R39_000037 [Caloplaca ligustica]